MYVQLRGNLLGEDVPPVSQGQAAGKDGGCSFRTSGGCICCSFLVLSQLAERGDTSTPPRDMGAVRALVGGRQGSCVQGLHAYTMCHRCDPGRLRHPGCCVWYVTWPQSSCSHENNSFSWGLWLRGLLYRSWAAACWSHAGQRRPCFCRQTSLLQCSRYGLQQRRSKGPPCRRAGVSVTVQPRRLIGLTLSRSREYCVWETQPLCRSAAAAVQASCRPARALRSASASSSLTWKLPSKPPTCRQLLQQQQPAPRAQLTGLQQTVQAEAAAQGL